MNSSKFDSWPLLTVAIRVVSDQFVALYNDNGNLRTCTLTSPLVTSLAGKRMRMAFYRFGTGTGPVVLGLAVDNGDGTITTYTNRVYRFNNQERADEYIVTITLDVGVMDRAKKGRSLWTP